jgi:hypothetical protein
VRTRGAVVEVAVHWSLSLAELFGRLLWDILFAMMTEGR